MSTNSYLLCTCAARTQQCLHQMFVVETLLLAVAIGYKPQWTGQVQNGKYLLNTQQVFSASQQSDGCTHASSASFIVLIQKEFSFKCLPQSFLVCCYSILVLPSCVVRSQRIFLGGAVPYMAGRNSDQLNKYFPSYKGSLSLSTSLYTSFLVTSQSRLIQGTQLTTFS